MTDEQSATKAVARPPKGDQMRKFCEFIAEGFTATEAAKAIGVSRRIVFYWRQQDPAFARQWTEAEETRVEALERAAYRRAIEGDAQLLKFLLASYAPERFSERSRVDVTTGGMPLNLTDTERAVRLLQLLSHIQQGTPLAPGTAPIDDAEWRELPDVEDLV